MRPLSNSGGLLLFSVSPKRLAHTRAPLTMPLFFGGAALCHAPGYGRPSLPDAGYWLGAAGAKRGNRRLPHHRHQAVSQASTELTTIPGTHSASPFQCPTAPDTAWATASAAFLSPARPPVG